MALAYYSVLLIILPVIVKSQSGDEPCTEYLKRNRCPANSECRLVQVKCFRAPCNIQPMCVRKAPEVSVCRYGHPVRDTQNRAISCSARRRCPASTTCNTEVQDTQSTCCWTPSGQVKPPPQPFDPCIATTCLVGTICEVQTPSTCFNPPCQPTGVCVDPARRGRCNLNCAGGQQCRLQEVNCFRAPCPPIPTCVRSTTVSDQCPVGRPVIDQSGRDIFCGRGGRRCPDQTRCNIHPTDRFAVCCDNTVDTPTTPIPIDPCLATTCIRGQVCRVQTPSTCFNPPCQPTGVCVGQLVKKGRCPASQGFGFCVNLCRYDDSCPGVQKCCSNGCGRTCQEPAGIKPQTQTKPGTCPRLRRGVAGTCVEACSSDGTCPGTQKCCSNGCGHTCQEPASVRPPRPVNKAGTCPRPRPGFAGICVEACSGDSSCPGTQKCCSNGCGHTCQEPASVRPPRPVNKAGTCPRPRPGFAGICVEACSGDSSCPGTQKCCSNGCGHTCQEPASIKPPGPVNKPGTCPRLAPGTVGTCVEACSGDGSCQGKQKCCSNGCGHTCQEPSTISNHETCQNKKCGRNSVCRIQAVRCARAPCPSGQFATCVPRRRPSPRPRPTRTNCPRTFDYNFNLFCSFFYVPCRRNSDCYNGNVCCYGGRHCGSRCVKPRSSNAEE